MTDRTQELAEEIIAALPAGTASEWGEAFILAVEEHGDDTVAAWLHDKQVAAMGRYVSGVLARRRAKERADRLIARGVSVATGRAITPTLSVRGEDGARQLVLWVEATPLQFIDAVEREQNVIEGRLGANRTRLAIAEAIKDDDHLMDAPTLAVVCERLGIDPDVLGLDELEAG